MTNLEFDKNKIKRFIARHGQEFTFKRAMFSNEFDEPIEQENHYDTVATVKGVFHEEVRHRVQEAQANAVTNKKNVPYILIAYDEAISKNIKYEDVVFVNGKEYRVQTVNDSNNYHVALDICLSEVLRNG